jgi:hypothetical protein
MIRLVYEGDARGCGAQARVSRVSDALEGQQRHVGVDRRVNAARNRCMSSSDLLVTYQKVRRGSCGAADSTSAPLRWAVLAHEKEAKMRRVLVLLAAAATLLVLAAGPAAADPGNQNTLSFTLNCGSAGTVDAVFELSSSDSFHIVQFSSNFLWKSLDYVTPDGQTGRIERGINGGGHSGLVTCTYIGAVSGNHYTVTGFFTP